MATRKASDAAVEETPKRPTVLCALDVVFKQEPDDASGGDGDGLFLGDVADATLRVADDEARRHNAALALMHVLPVEPGAPMSPAGVEDALVTRERLTRIIGDSLTRAVERLGPRPPDDLAVLVEDGPADEAIVRTAERLAADLVVLGETGARSRRQRLLGSTAASVVNRAPCSVFVVRYRGPGNGNGARP
jgi:nucleotide-binding universal stress UspA family protein